MCKVKYCTSTNPFRCQVKDKRRTSGHGGCLYRWRPYCAVGHKWHNWMWHWCGGLCCKWKQDKMKEQFYKDQKALEQKNLADRKAWKCTGSATRWCKDRVSVS